MNTNELSTQNQLTGKALVLYNQILTVGELEPDTFTITSRKFTKIKDLEPDVFRDLIRIIMTTIAFKAKVKNPITKLDKADIKKMLLTKYKSLSLQEIEYAFQLERYGSYEKRSKHFQVFDCEYVSSILNKYLVWLKKSIKHNQIEIEKIEEEEAKKQVSEDYKNRIAVGLIIRTYQSYLYHKKIPYGCYRAYDALLRFELIDPITEEIQLAYTPEIKKRMRGQVSESYRTGRLKSLKEHWESFEGSKKDFEVHLKEIYLENHFQAQIKEKKDYERFLEAKTGIQISK